MSSSLRHRSLHTGPRLSRPQRPMYLRDVIHTRYLPLVYQTSHTHTVNLSASTQHTLPPSSTPLPHSTHSHCLPLHTHTTHTHTVFLSTPTQHTHTLTPTQHPHNTNPHCPPHKTHTTHHHTLFLTTPCLLQTSPCPRDQSPTRILSPA